MLVWADIENQPQVQYLLPVIHACRRRGARTVISARDDGATLTLLENRGETFEAVGASYGAGTLAKVRGLVRRTRALEAFIRREGVPDCLVCASRAAVLAARRHGVASYLISDYEHSNMTAFRLARSTILHPDVIDSVAYRKKGFPERRVIPFHGLKEDLTFADVDLEGIEPTFLPGANSELVLVLVRPPADESHYYSQDSRALYLQTLERLAGDPRALIVLVPRYARQAADLAAFAFANAPVVLDRPVPFVSLLKAVDLVLCSGGTMLREAAYLGIPAYSIFRSRVGQVDKYLESIGRAVVLSSPEALDTIRLEKAPTLSPLAINPNLVNDITDMLMDSPRARERTSVAPP